MEPPQTISAPAYMNPFEENEVDMDEKRAAFLPTPPVMEPAPQF